MGVLVDLEARRFSRRRTVYARKELPLILSQLLAAGATDFTRIALDAWGKQEMDADELLELCATYAAVAGLENV